MKALSQRSLKTMAAWYRETHGLRARFFGPDGGLVGSAASAAVDGLTVMQQARSHALQEAVRWGEPYSFFLAPGVLSWVVPVVEQYDVWGGVLGGEVLTEGAREDRAEAVDHLVRHGAARADARRFLERLPVWPQARCQEAAEKLHEIVYRVTGLAPQLLLENRERHQQQRQIAEEIHRRKDAGRRPFPADEEQALLSLIRVGDRKGARKILNRMLGRVFCRTANITILRALVIEMMGYLVRRAVEDSPFLETIMEKNHQWMAKIIEASDFESLAVVVRRALDDFMDHVYEMGYAACNPQVGAALQYLAGHYREAVTLADVAEVSGLSTWRIAHLVKEQTGRSMIRHLHGLRIEAAKKALVQSRRSCAEIALDVGFCDQSYFTRQFKKHTGLTPARYRRNSGGYTRENP